MKVYFLFNPKKICDNKVNEYRITELAKNIFLKDVTDFKKQKCEKLTMGKSLLDYYCVIDEKIDDDPLGKKRKFSDELMKFMEEETQNNLNGIVKIQTGFEMSSISPEKNKENYSNDETDSKMEFDYEKRSEMYTPLEPAYTFDRVILPSVVMDKIEESLSIIEYENKVFKEWGLSVIQPNPSSCLSFFGPSGTGKTMAAEAIAHKLNKKILRVSYADIESKYHGEGPKNIKAIFLAAQKEDAVLFIDEADSLLSKRLTNVTNGSDQAINSMRSQLLICLEQFHGIVIFATNLVVNYDQAFLTRLISVEFIKPDLESREKIWNVHIKPTNNNGLNIPLADNVDTHELAEKFELCGREIRKAVISACINAAMHSQEYVSQQNFVDSCEKLINEEKSLAKAEDHTASVRNNSANKLNSEQENILKAAIKQKLNSQKN